LRFGLLVALTSRAILICWHPHLIGLLLLLRPSTFLAELNRDVHFLPGDDAHARAPGRLALQARLHSVFARRNVAQREMPLIVRRRSENRNWLAFGGGLRGSFRGGLVTFAGLWLVAGIKALHIGLCAAANLGRLAWLHQPHHRTSDRLAILRDYAA